MTKYENKYDQIGKGSKHMCVLSRKNNGKKQTTGLMRTKPCCEEGPELS